MIERALRGLAAAVAIAAAAAVAVVSAAFAIYAAALPWVGPAWAAAIVTGVMALTVLAGGLMLRPHAPPRRAQPDAPDASLVDKVVGLAREHPLIAAGAAVGVGLYAIRNPKLVAAIATAFMAGRSEAD